MLQSKATRGKEGISWLMPPDMVHHEAKSGQGLTRIHEAETMEECSLLLGTQARTKLGFL